MAENKKWFQEFICDIQELKAKKEELYRKAVLDCDDPVGKETFALLQKEESESVQGLRAIQDKLEENGKLDPACIYHPERMSPADFIVSLAEKHIKDGKACSKQVDALDVGIDMEQQAIRLIEGYMSKVSSEDERKILELLLEEDKEHFRSLKDLKFYFSDPHGWLLEKGRGGLDGA